MKTSRPALLPAALIAASQDKPAAGGHNAAAVAPDRVEVIHPSHAP